MQDVCDTASFRMKVERVNGSPQERLTFLKYSQAMRKSDVKES